MYWYLVVFIKAVLQNFKNFVILRLHYKGKRDAQKNVSHIDKNMQVGIIKIMIFINIMP